jgi:predicted nucleic acid-binding Zn ribbon protein
MAPRKQPRPLGPALEAALRPLAPATLLGSVQSRWEHAVGKKIAAESTPVSERDGVITVACRSATWAHELDLLGDQVLSKLRSELPEATSLRGLRFTASREPD